MCRTLGCLLLALSLLMTSCFEVVEEISLNDDGSGSVTMTVNISKSKTKLKSVMLMDSINSYKVPSEADIKSNMAKMIREIESINGVSNVDHKMNFNDFIFSVSCDFSNIDVLNSVITHFSSDGQAAQMTKHKQFTFDASRKVFVRSYHYNLSDEIHRVKSEDREVLKDASVTTIYRFESPIAATTNQDARIAGNKKAVMLKVGITDMINNKKNIKNTITLD